MTNIPINTLNTINNTLSDRPAGLAYNRLTFESCDKDHRGRFNKNSDKQAAKGVFLQIKNSYTSYLHVQSEVYHLNAHIYSRNDWRGALLYSYHALLRWLFSISSEVHLLAKIQVHSHWQWLVIAMVLLHGSPCSVLLWYNTWTVKIMNPKLYTNCLLQWQSF